MAEARRQELDIRRDVAEELGRSAVEIGERGFYLNAGGENVDIGELVAIAVAAKRTLPPDAALPTSQQGAFSETRILGRDLALGRTSASG